MIVALSFLLFGLSLAALPPCNGCYTEIGSTYYQCCSNMNVYNNVCTCGGSSCVQCSPSSLDIKLPLLSKNISVQTFDCMATLSSGNSGYKVGISAGETGCIMCTELPPTSVSLYVSGGIVSNNDDYTICLGASSSSSECNLDSNDCAQYNDNQYHDFFWEVEYNLYPGLVIGCNNFFDSCEFNLKFSVIN